VSDIFQEVQEEYRREQMAKLWKSYQVPVIAAVTVIILAVAGYQGWSYWHTQQLEASSREFEKIAEFVAANGTDPAKKKEAADRFAKLATTATSAYAMAAKFQEAGLRAELLDIKAAQTIYDDIIATTSDPLFRDYAQLRWAILVLETESLENIRKRVEPIAKGTGAWRVMGLELLAYAAWRGGKKDEALKLYDEVAGAPNAPNGSLRRAKEMTTLINAGMKLTDLKPAPGLSIPGSEPLLLQPKEPSPAMDPLLPDAAGGEPSLLGPGPTAPEPETPATPEQPSPPTP
jgi:hypothetical protein